MYLFGGLSQDLFADLRRINMYGYGSTLLTQHEHQVTPIARCYHTLNVFKNRYLYLFGGASTCIKSINMRLCLNDLFIYDIQLNQWERMKENKHTPGSRMGHTSANYGSMLVFHGGYNTEVRKIMGEVHIYDMRLQKWIRCIISDPKNTAFLLDVTKYNFEA
jgi:hypothetical protein